MKVNVDDSVKGQFKKVAMGDIARNAMTKWISFKNVWMSKSQ